jgi:flagellar hook protein FlgE
MIASAASAAVLSSGYNIAVSGMQAENLQFAAAADNIANADTPGYATERINLQPLPGGGVETAAEGIPPADPSVSNGDLGQQMADMMTSSSLYTADAKVVSVESEMDHALFDMLA